VEKGALGEIEKALGGRVTRSEPLSCHTTWRVGGPADLFIEAISADDLRDIVRLARQYRVPYFILGGGSNILVSDAGIRGLVILNKARRIEFQIGDQMSTIVNAESGVILPTLVNECIERGLAGLEWAIGIPGTVGGAVIGNAGAYGGEIAQALVSASILDSDGNVRDWPTQALGFGYRSSILKSEIQNPGPIPVVLGAKFGLRPSTPDELKTRAAEFSARRRRMQPPGASAGSVFKNPPGDRAGRLIEAAGLKGVRAGDAAVSTAHANFFVNLGAATAADIYSLICLVRERVRAQFGVTLELEIQLVGEW